MKKTTKPAASTRTTARSRISAADALKRPRRDIEVKASSKAALGPDGEHAAHFHLVRIESFKDLQRMSLIPDGLDEKKTRDAIARDNDTAFEVVQRMPATAAAGNGCDCHGNAGHVDHDPPAAGPRRSAGAMLRAQYGDLRATFNPGLARHLTDVYGRDVQWDHAVATHVYRWVDRLVATSAFDVGTIMIRDITVNRNATLNIAPGAQVLWGNRIRIHTGGRIVTTGSYLKVKCASIEGNLA